MEDMEILKQVLNGSHLEEKDIERLKQLSHDIENRLINELDLIKSIREEHFTKVSHDINGNPRYVIHFLTLLTNKEKESYDINNQYEIVIKRAKKWGGKKFHNKQYGGGIVFQSYSLSSTCNFLSKELQKLNEVKK
jgi:hypothetical protein